MVWRFAKSANLHSAGSAHFATAVSPRSSTMQQEPQMCSPLQSGRSASGPRDVAAVAPGPVPAMELIRTLSHGPDLRLWTKVPLAPRKDVWQQALAAAREAV